MIINCSSLFKTGKRYAAGSYWQPSPVKMVAQVEEAVETPARQKPYSAVQKEFDATNVDQRFQLVLSGNMGYRKIDSYAYFPTVGASDRAYLEKIFVTTEPITSEISHEGEKYDIDTKYRKVTVSEAATTETIITTTVYVSDDFDPQACADVGKMCAYFGRTGVFITAISDGMIVGDSFHLALVAALMSLPPVVALTGAIVLEQYPVVSKVGPVGDIKIKLQCTVDHNMKLVMPYGSSVTQEGLQLSQVMDTFITMIDITAAGVERPDWAAISIATVNEIATAVMAAFYAARRLVVMKEGAMYQQIKTGPTVAPSMSSDDKVAKFKEAGDVFTDAMLKTAIANSPVDGLVTEIDRTDFMDAAKAYLIKSLETRSMKDPKGRKLNTVEEKQAYMFSDFADIDGKSVYVGMPANQFDSLVDNLFSLTLIGDEKIDTTPFYNTFVRPLIKKRMNDLPDDRKPKKAPIKRNVVRKFSIGDFFKSTPTEPLAVTAMPTPAKHKPLSDFSRPPPNYRPDQSMDTGVTMTPPPQATHSTAKRLKTGFTVNDLLN